MHQRRATAVPGTQSIAKRVDTDRNLRELCVCGASEPTIYGLHNHVVRYVAHMLFVMHLPKRGQESHSQRTLQLRAVHIFVYHAP